MVVLIDSGSTKADFIFIDENKNKVLQTHTKGFNPLFNTSDEISQALREKSEINQLASKVKEVHFFGAGCSSNELNNIIKQGFQWVFSNAKCTINSDLLAACYAVYKNAPTLVGILGTGSNACYFEGTAPMKETPSLGFVLGDEGSGNHIGRELVRAYYTKKLPASMTEKFDMKFGLSLTELLNQVYRKSKPNAYLAKFNEFAFEHKENPYIRNLLRSCFQDYFTYQIAPYAAYGCKEIGFVGSIAYLYQDIVKEVATEFGFSIHKFVQKPIDELVDYYLK